MSNIKEYLFEVAAEVRETIPNEVNIGGYEVDIYDLNESSLREVVEYTFEVYVQKCGDVDESSFLEGYSNFIQNIVIETIKMEFQ